MYLNSLKISNGCSGIAKKPSLSKRLCNFASLTSLTVSSTACAERGPEFVERLSDEELAEYHAKQAIIRGALQIVASRLVGQLTQERAGDHEMYRGLNRMEEIQAASKTVPSDR